MASHTAEPILSEAERQLYLEGIRLFNRHQFFEAHEVWEDIWRPSTGIKREFLQGLIQCAVALEHYRRGNSRGVLSLYETYRRHFSHVPAVFLGLDVARFLAAMKRCIQPVIDVGNSLAEPQVPLHPSRAPLLSLSDEQTAG